jgi:hypothetical protein
MRRPHQGEPKRTLTSHDRVSGTHRPATFTPLTYSPTLGGSFEELPWCGLRPKGGNDGSEFDEYLDDPGTYPSLDGITDPDSGDPLVSCKVFVSENASGIQVTVVLVQDDPYWQ